jgi:small subunit ribosomal protein S17
VSKTRVRGQRKIRVGEVVSDRMNKTIIVQVERLMQHPLYRKRIRRRRKLYAHDENNACHIGDKVKIIETRPLSKLKRWRLLEVVSRAE